jgi:hypothetical protein
MEPKTLEEIGRGLIEVLSRPGGNDKNCDNIACIPALICAQNLQNSSLGSYYKTRLLDLVLGLLKAIVYCGHWLNSARVPCLLQFPFKRNKLSLWKINFSNL